MQPVVDKSYKPEHRILKPLLNTLKLSAYLNPLWTVLLAASAFLAERGFGLLLFKSGAHYIFPHAHHETVRI